MSRPHKMPLPKSCASTMRIPTYKAGHSSVAGRSSRSRCSATPPWPGSRWYRSMPCQRSLRTSTAAWCRCCSRNPSTSGATSASRRSSTRSASRKTSRRSFRWNWCASRRRTSATGRDSFAPGASRTSIENTSRCNPTMTVPAVRFEQVGKRFVGVQALTEVSLAVAEGSCHALCGENGAGKSTLGKILAGIHRPDAGRLFVHGRPVSFDSPRDALEAGVGMVHQELAFCENLSVAENLLLGGMPARRGFVDRAAMKHRAHEMLEEIGARIDVRVAMRELTIAQQQLVQIAAAVCGGASIIVFDEPTSSLSQADADRLYALIGQLKTRGVTCIYVSHRMAEIYRLCDTISVLRDGRHVATHPAADLSESELVRLMIGRALGEYLPAAIERPPGKALLRVEGLAVAGKFRDVSLTLHEGVIVGLA